MRRLPPKLIIFFTIFIDLVGFGMLIPIIPFYSEQLHLDPAQKGQFMGLLMGGYSLFQFIFAPVWGRLSDRVGRRPVLITSLLGFSVAYCLGGLSTSAGFLLFTRILAGTFAANIATAQAYIADITTQEDRAKGMGLVGAAFGLGFAVGPSVGGVLVRYGFTPPFMVMAALSATAAACAFFLLPESHPPEARGRRVARGLFNTEKIAMAWNHPPAVMLIFIFFLATFAFANLEATLAFFTEWKLGLSVVTFSYIFAYIGVLGAIVQGGLVGRMVKRYRELTTLLVGLLVLAGGLALVATVHSTAQLMLVLVPVSLGVGLSNPTLLGAISRLIPPTDQGAIAGLTQAASSMARIAGPIVGGLLYDHAGRSVPFFFAAGVILAAFIISATLWPRRGLILSTSHAEPR